ncbi:MAG: ergothioneine biosynthesis protein EgtB [Acidimicrobiia bacterium]
MTAITKSEIAAALGDARERTLALLGPVGPADEVRQHSPLMSPLVWDLAHIAHYEELWLVRELAGAPPTDPRLDDVYDAFKHPRRERPSLDLLDPDQARAFATGVRARSLDVLDTIDLDAEDPLRRDGFVYGMVVQHEHQHIETMLATLQLRDTPYPAPGRPTAARATQDEELCFPRGPFTMGTDDEPWAYDNERPAHVVELAPYRIDAGPVTNRAFLGFVAAGGYEDARWWSDAGWRWRRDAGLTAPEFWRRAGDDWYRRRFGCDEPLTPEEPVQHVCWYEADAYARFVGKRLPTEAEWERAAASFDGVGSVWEWTASDFRAYPGFRAFPYREYSEVFFGDEYKVLRGGSWATHPTAQRETFRNWDYPTRRQIFSGFRCAA